VTVTTLAFIPSPDQGVWFLGPVPIRAYALCIIVGIIAALVIGDRRWEARGGERGVIYDIALWAVPFGLVGGRIYHVLTDWPTYFGAGGAGLWAAFRVWDGGLGIWGAVALGGVGAWIGCKRRGIPLPAFGDAVAPGIILAQAIGRLGNYFNQELFGRSTDLPWGLEIYERRDAAGFRDSINGVSTGELVGVVHPTFLYELLWNVLIFALLIWVDRRYKLGHGRVFALYVAGYCLGRFWIELMRADTATLIAGIRVNSFTSTFIFIAAVVYVMVAPKGREDPETLRGDADDDGESVVEDVITTEVIEMGAAAGIVAAATVAGAGESDDSAKPDADYQASAEEVSVADAADEADDVEEPVETEVLAAAESEPEAADGEESVETPAEEAEAEGDATDVAAEEPEAGDAVAVDEPAETPAETEESPEVEAADDDSAAADESMETPAEETGAETAEVAAEVVEAETEGDAPEPAAAETEAVVETPDGEAADDATDVAAEEPAVETEESPETEVAEGDSVDTEVAVETPSDVVAEVVTEVPAEAEESPVEAEAVEAEAEEPVAVDEPAEEETAAAEESPEAEATEGDSGDAELVVEEPAVEESVDTPAETEEPSAETEAEESAAEAPAGTSDTPAEPTATAPKVRAPVEAAKRWWQRRR
jgi:prolipoprotein diacylglyceryl transferase